MTRRRSAFTIIEVMIVLVIILALSGIVAVNLLGRKKQADEQLAAIDLNTIKSALKMFRLDYDRWPTDDEGLEVLWNIEALDPDADETKWHKYLEEPMPTDRWGHEWGYSEVSENGDESNYDLWSDGPDGEEGTDDDITSWTETDGGYGDDLMPPPPDNGGP